MTIVCQTPLVATRQDPARSTAPTPSIPALSEPMPDAMSDAGASGSRRRFAAVVSHLAAALAAWRARVRERRRLHLPRLDDRMVRDLGLDRSVVDPDSSASFWRLR